MTKAKLHALQIGPAAWDVWHSKPDKDDGTPTLNEHFRVITPSAGEFHCMVDDSTDCAHVAAVKAAL